FTNNVNNTTMANNRVQQRNTAAASGQGRSAGGSWQHNPEHRKGVQYRDSASQQRYNKSGPANPQPPDQFPGPTGPGAQGSDLSRASQQGGPGQGGARDRQGGAGQQGGAGPAGARDRQAGAGQQPGRGAGDRGGQAASRGGNAGQGAGGARQSGAFEG